MMSVQTKELSARPMGDYLYFYHQARRPWIFLYYCKRCIRNFDATSRVTNCTKCGGESIVELPKGVHHKIKYTRHGPRWITREEKGAWRKELAHAFDNIMKQLRRDTRRLRVWYYYATAPTGASSSLQRVILAERNISEFV